MGSFFRPRGGVTGGRHGVGWAASRARLWSEWVRFFEAAGASSGGGAVLCAAPRGGGCGGNGFFFPRRRGRRRGRYGFVSRGSGEAEVGMGSFFRGRGGVTGGR